MRKRNVFVLFLAAVVLIAVFMWASAFPLKAATDSGVTGKIDQVLQNQNRIISELAGIKEELTKIKYRTR